jgi:hypothetical protein
MVGHASIRSVSIGSVPPGSVAAGVLTRKAAW